jgi:hypothetical protein
MPKFENMSAEHYAVDTEVPLSNFSHCHIGILHHLDHLSELLQVMGDAQAAKKIAKEALDYFHLGMKAHHQEEGQGRRTSSCARGSSRAPGTCASR